jgi:two-component system, OmpR family, sensor histidine kinase KdpD
MSTTITLKNINQAFAQLQKQALNLRPILPAIAELIESDGLLQSVQNPLQHELATEIHRAGTRLNHLVGNLLDMTRLESGHLLANKQWCNIVDILATSLSRTKAELSAQNIRLESASDLVFAKCDAVLIEQALVNILLNASRYTPAGTQIVCGVQEGETDVVITVCDNGPGVSNDALAQLFTKFYRTPNTRAGGTGLGLSISKGFIEAHGGTISAEHVAGGGLQFTIRLPRGGVLPDSILV